ncbi:ABC transporter substrate-binding protein [Pseudomonas lopnurensis]|uniref:ABC transporter substrate-binding protein n=1 Tax=Pseudomonas lopnurensis TaxID=1477517 RepID=UPI00187A8DDA|nr:extracellular solute-binding protein [Pseudomonas lopnurensis]MBE7376531.1 extracellular solute-binding protein [Pseudomonas lopnurensis]
MPHLMNRRRLLGGLAGLGLACAARPLLAGTPRELVILSSYPEPVIAAFEAAFERLYPQYRMNLVWRRPHDALEQLSQPGQGGVDVYWAASPRTFEALRQAGAWRPLTIDRAGLPEHVGALPLVGPDAHYLATEIAGYGFAIDPRQLAELGVDTPVDWADLANPRLAGRIALPVPSRVGFAPVMVDIVLQAYGWERGWALWSEIAGLSYLIERGSTFVSDEVGSERAAVGLSIDFFVASAIAGGAPLQFIYPAHGGLNPGHIAITASTQKPEAAEAFVAFVLSATGQKLLAAPDIRKLPVRPSVYTDLPAGYHDPFRAAAAGAYAYRPDPASGRLGLLAALFEQLLVSRHAELRQLWADLHARERREGRRLEAVRQLLGTPPIDAHQAADPALLAAWRSEAQGTSRATDDQQREWARQVAQRQHQAAVLLAGMASA